MAVIVSYLPFLDECRRAGAFADPVWALGSLELPDAAALSLRRATEQVAPAARGVHVSTGARPEDGERWGGRTLADLLRDRYGVAEFADFDLNDDAAVRLDLTSPLPAERRGGAGTVLEAGTLEHVFDFPAVLENVHEMLRTSGMFVGLVPVSAWDHGFVNINRKLVRSLAAANAYELLAEGFWFRVRMPVAGKRFVTVMTRDATGVRRRNELWVDRLLNRLLPSDVLYLTCWRKTHDAPFRAPTDIFGNWH